VFGRKTGSDEFNGFLGQGTTVTGDMYFSGTLHLDGNIRGSVTTADVLIVGRLATVEARIKAGEVQISGTVIGDINAARRVEICPEGRLIGDVQTAQLVIHEGGVFQGTSLGAAEPLEPQEVGQAKVTEFSASQS
jgi:cytoskeletal protein CcmA (bactofilin family)